MAKLGVKASVVKSYVFQNLAEMQLNKVSRRHFAGASSTCSPILGNYL